MPDLPGLETVATGGIIGSILAACGWLILRFRDAVGDGEALAETRITALTRDIKEYRERAELDRAAIDAEVKALRSELDDYRNELAEARRQLRQCRAESHEMKLAVDNLTMEVLRLGGSV